MPRGPPWGLTINGEGRSPESYNNAPISIVS